MAEMTATGGLKWFMVKTSNGNIGWIKAGENNAAKRVEVISVPCPTKSQ